jgi:uncharacterized metal-binding protein
MPRETTLECARCPVDKYARACDSESGPGPGGCPTRTAEETVAAALERYRDPEIAELARQASIQEGLGYDRTGAVPRPVKTRLEELCDFARRMGYHRLGLAFCGGLTHEARLLDEVLSAQGFEVVSAVCKVGAVAKEELGLADGDKIRPGGFEAMCNPVAQAELLNRADTDLNIMMGLCVGHDALFLSHVTAPTTVFAVKDRVLGHNPMVALYTSGSYSRWLYQKGE